MIILDTNVLSALMRDTPDPVIVAWLNLQPRPSVWTTAVTELELRFGIGIMPEGGRRKRRLVAFQRMFERTLEGRVLPFDGMAAEQSAALSVTRRAAGRPVDLRDTMIAGIALARRGTLATGNVRHFQDLSVPIVDPWHV